MRATLALLLAVTLAAAFPAAARTSGTGPPCGAATLASGDCCSGVPAGVDCPPAGCVGAGAALPFASPDRGIAARISEAPESFLALLTAPPARAPDTAPPKPAV